MSLADGKNASVKATLHYLSRTERKPYLYMCDPPEGVPAMWGELNTVTDVVVRNARLRREPPSLHEEGFQFHVHQTVVTDFYDERQIREVYYPEVETLLKNLTGAEKVLIFDHTIRSIPRIQAGAKGMREPTRHVHNDYTEESGPQRVIDLLPLEEAQQRLKRRFMEVNIWRPIRGPLQDAPLAVCDARSIAPGDRIAADLIYRDRRTETYSFNYSPDHRWYYYPEMAQNEAIIFKGFDSDKNAKARFTAHTAFDDPSAPPKVVPRESIEVRALIFMP